MANRYYFVRSSRRWLTFMVIRVAPTPQAQACAVCVFGSPRAPSWILVVTRLSPPTLSGFPSLRRWLRVYRDSRFPLLSPVLTLFVVRAEVTIPRVLYFPGLFVRLAPPRLRLRWLVAPRHRGVHQY